LRIVVVYFILKKGLKKHGHEVAVSAYHIYAHAADRRQKALRQQVTMLEPKRVIAA
jgi:hypothetical protein